MIAAKIKRGMRVIAADDWHVGCVSRVEDDMLRVMTGTEKGVGYDHLIPLSWVDKVSGYVFLNRPLSYLAANWHNDVRLKRVAPRLDTNSQLAPSIEPERDELACTSQQPGAEGDMLGYQPSSRVDVQERGGTERAEGHDDVTPARHSRDL